MWIEICLAAKSYLAPRSLSAASRRRKEGGAAARACASRNVGQSLRRRLTERLPRWGGAGVCLTERGPKPARTCKANLPHPNRGAPTAEARPRRRQPRGRAEAGGGLGGRAPHRRVSGQCSAPPQQRGPNGRVGAPRRAGGRGGGPRARPPLARVGTPQSRPKQRAAVSGAARPPRGGPGAKGGRGEKGGAGHSRRGKCFKQGL